ncbi:MAG: LON peptidase substrate-binding domain-containing protein [Planctomycetota bacterium]
MPKPHLDIPGILDAFQGTARLFPLPSIVLLPDTFVPLNVFEDRYLQMVKDALPDDGLIATALLEPGYEKDYAGTPPIRPVVCLGRILKPRLKPNGHIELFLYGLARGRITEEIPAEPYRKARIELLQDVVSPGTDEQIAERLYRTLDLMPGRQPHVWGLRQTAATIRGVDAAPGRFADAMATASGLAAPVLYEVLAEVDVLRRFETLIRHLETQAAEGAPPLVSGSDPRWN